MASNLPPLFLRRLLIFGIGLVALVLAAGGCPVVAADAPVALTARAGVHGDFDRLVIEGPRELAYTVSREGERVTLAFKQAANLNLRPFTDGRLTRARDFVAAGDPLAVSFTVAATATLKDFRSGAAIVVDVYGPVATATPVAVAKTEPPPAKIEPPPAKIDTPPPVAATPPPKAESPPTSVAATPAPQPVAAAKPAVEDKAAAPPPVALPKPVVAEALPSFPAEIKKPASAALPPDAFADVGFSPELVAALDPGVTTGAAIFARAGYGYILFDRKMTLDSAALTAKQTPPRVRLEPVDLTRTNGFRFPMPQGLELRATRQGTVWQLFFSKPRSEISVSTGLVAQPDFALGARVLLPVPDAPEPVRFVDPVVGDNLIVLPLLETEAFSVLRTMADFTVVPSAQGLVLAPRHERLTVRSVSDGVEITSAGGLRLSPATDTGSSQQSANKAKAAATGKSVFDFAGWGSKPNETFTTTRQRLMQTIVDVPEGERNRARLELARFYFSQGMGAEALALLGFLVQQIPDLPTHPEFLVLRGASNILAGHAQEGLLDFADSGMSYQPEVALWVAVALAQLRDWPTAEEKFALTENILVSYPEPFYSRFSILAIEAAEAAGKDREAAEWLDRLETNEHPESIRPAILYLRGVLHSRNGRAEVARTLWREAKGLHDQLYKIRAELALVDLGVATKSLTPIQAAERLEGLRYAWRGDGLELDILHRLGTFYIEAKKYREGLTMLAQAVRLYPYSVMTPEIRKEMAKDFHDIFLGGAIEDMTPVDALTLFQDFRDLMPEGEDGKALIRNLAERLVAIDLLEQAAALLDKQVKDDVAGEGRARTGARLAAIRLLDHKAAAAMAALDASNSDGLPAALVNERQLLRARALSEMGKEDEAIALLKDNDTKPAKMLRADITMRAQRWDEAATALLDLVGEPPKPGETLDANQAQWLVNTAIALSLAGNMTGLDKLAIDFGAAMSGTNQADTFRVLTRPEKASQMRDIAAAQSKITEVDMFRGFLDTYRAAPAAKP